MNYNVRITEYPHEREVIFHEKRISKRSEEDKQLYKELQLQKTETDKKQINNSKSDSARVSLNRTINKIYYLTRSNEWEYFFTLTFDQKEYDTTDIKVVSDLFTKWVNNMKHNYAPDMKYIFVPELHADGKHLHLHGLASNIPEYVFTDSGHKSKGKIVYNVNTWGCGFSTATKVANSDASAKYITKYVTKELHDKTKGAKRYYASRNLDKAPIVNTEYKKDLIDTILDTEEILSYKTVKNTYNDDVITYIQIKR